MYTVYTSQNGSIALNNCLTLPYDTVLRIVLCSRNIFSSTPVLITNIQHATRSPSKKGSPKKPQKGYKKILRGEEEGQLPMPFYSVFEPQRYNISNNGDYVFEIKCRQLGPCFLRIIWLQILHKGSLSMQRYSMYYSKQQINQKIQFLSRKIILVFCCY